jgi:hypothetical protein
LRRRGLGRFATNGNTHPHGLLLRGHIDGGAEWLECAALWNWGKRGERIRNLGHNEIPTTLQPGICPKDEPAVAASDTLHAFPPGISYGNLDARLGLINIAAVAAVVINVAVDDDRQRGVSESGAGRNWQ